MKRIFALALLLLSSLGLSAQTPSLGAYLEGCPFLSEAERQALLASAPEVRPALDAVYSAPTSTLSSCHIRLYPMVNGTPLIGVIERIAAPEADSRLTFYTPTWEAIPLESLIALPGREQFAVNFAGDTSPEAERLRQLLTPLHYHIDWEAGGALAISASLPLSQEDEASEPLKALAGALPTYRFVWKNYRFEPAK